MAQSGGNTIAEIYKGVIQDVISQVKEAFLDENVDIDVLTQLKKNVKDENRLRMVHSSLKQFRRQYLELASHQ
ncbi:hypothetical protein COOONC_15417 [Cooperia oncophora]